MLRRVAYAENYLALAAPSVPMDGLFDTALTNGLLAIVSSEWPGEDQAKDGRTLPASSLLDVVRRRGGLELIVVESLQEAIALTQPVRHGRADDEDDVVTSSHINALGRLDSHPARAIVEKCRNKTHDQCLVIAYYERANDELPAAPKERVDHPDPDDCDECARPTFIRSGWDSFGGTMTGGFCVACGFELSEADASDRAFDADLRERLNDPRT